MGGEEVRQVALRRLRRFTHLLHFSAPVAFFSPRRLHSSPKFERQHGHKAHGA